MAQVVDTSTSSASRICAELEALGLLARAPAYGTYRIGSGALAISGRAAQPYSAVVDFALTVAHQATGETVALVAASPAGAMVIAVVESAWTLRVATRVGDLITEAHSAAHQALGLVAMSDPAGVATSTIGETSELATPILTSSGDQWRPWWCGTRVTDQSTSGPLLGEPCSPPALSSKPASS